MSFVYTILGSESNQKTSSLRKPKVYLAAGLATLAVIIIVHLGSSSAQVQWPDVSALKDKIPHFGSAAPQIHGYNASDFANYEYWREDTGNPIPQVEEDAGYIDRILGHADDAPSSTKDVAVSKQSKDRAIFLPTYPGHFHQALMNIRSLQCLCTDIQKFDIVTILSNRKEVEEFEVHAIEYLSKPCPSPFGKFELKQPHKPFPNLRYVNMYDVLPQTLKKMKDVNENSTQPIMDKVGKYKYQGIKKMQTTRYFSYEHVLYLDSEGVAVQPFSMGEIFDKNLADPIIWRSRFGWLDPLMKPVMHSSAKILGRSIDSFGENYWNLESLQWIVERAIVEDMYQWVERAHSRNFWDVYIDFDDVFEITLYNMHIAARKLETRNDSIFAKYRVLEVERELIRYGLGPALKLRKDGPHGGILEYVATLLKRPGVQPKLTGFLQHYNFHLIRIDKIDVVDRNTMERFLIDSQISMLVCGTPDIHKWWNEDFSDPEPMEWSEEEQKLRLHELAGLLDGSIINVR